MQRRTLLKLGTGSATFLALTGAGLSLYQPGLERGRLSQQGKVVFKAIGRAVLDGSLPAETRQRAVALEDFLHRLDDAVAAFPDAVKSELSQLLALLCTAPGRIGLAGLRAHWPEANVEQVQAALQSMRLSSVSLRQQAYHALRDLTNAAYYADSSAWPLLGYPGPREI